MSRTRPETVSPASRQAAAGTGVRVRTAAIGRAKIRVSVPSACTTATVPARGETLLHHRGRRVAARREHRQPDRPDHVVDPAPASKLRDPGSTPNASVARRPLEGVVGHLLPAGLDTGEV